MFNMNTFVSAIARKKPQQLRVKKQRAFRNCQRLKVQPLESPDIIPELYQLYHITPFD